MSRNQMNIVFPYCLLQFAIPLLPKESLMRFVPKYSFWAALKHGIRNPETETETESRKRERKQKRKLNTESNINDRKLKNFTLHNLVQSKENLC